MQLGRVFQLHRRVGDCLYLFLCFTIRFPWLTFSLLQSFPLPGFSFFFPATIVLFYQFFFPFSLFFFSLDLTTLGRLILTLPGPVSQKFNFKGSRNCIEGWVVGWIFVSCFYNPLFTANLSSAAIFCFLAFSSFSCVFYYLWFPSCDFSLPLAAFISFSLDMTTLGCVILTLPRPVSQKYSFEGSFNCIEG